MPKSGKDNRKNNSAVSSKQVTSKQNKKKKTKVTEHKKFILIVASVFILLVIIIFALVNSCGKKTEDNVDNEDNGQLAAETINTTRLETTKTTTLAESQKPKSIFTNHLTGLPLEDEKMVGQRPIALMINNVQVANPQLGVGAADLVFEMEVEGGLTRMMAYFACADLVPEIGSIRSARHNFVDLAGAFDAVLVSVGGSYMAMDQIYAQQTAHLDGQVLSKTFWRDEQWKKNRGYEHSVRTDGEKLRQAIIDLGLRDEVKEEYAHPFAFRDDEKTIAKGDLSAIKVRIPLSASSYTTMLYDEEKEAYEKMQHGAVQADFNDGTPYSFTNVLILQTTVTNAAGSDILREINLSAGEGFYISGGKARAISWEKGGTFDRFQFYEQDGSTIEFNRGRFYIAIVSRNGTPEFSAELD